MIRAFVTGIGTNVGKTYITALFIRYLRERGVSVRAAKPLLTGYCDDAPEDSDSAILLNALGESVTSETIAAISPWRYRAALAPGTAAKVEGKRLLFDEVSAFTIDFFQRSRALFTLVEGIGGVMVPCDGDRTVLDLIAYATVPAVLVAATYLGALSHTLTALEMLEARGIAVAAVVVNESLESTVTLDQTIEALLPFFAKRRAKLLCLTHDPTDAERNALCRALFDALAPHPAHARIELVR